MEDSVGDQGMMVIFRLIFYVSYEQATLSRTCPWLRSLPFAYLPRGFLFFIIFTDNSPSLALIRKSHRKRQNALRCIRAAQVDYHCY